CTWHSGDVPTTQDFRSAGMPEHAGSNLENRPTGTNDPPAVEGWAHSRRSEPSLDRIVEGLSLQLNRSWTRPRASAIGPDRRTRRGSQARVLGTTREPARTPGLSGRSAFSTFS